MFVYYLLIFAISKEHLRIERLRIASTKETGKGWFQTMTEKNEPELTHDDEQNKVSNAASKGKKHETATTCVSFVHQNVLVEAVVTVTPHVTVGDDFGIHCGDVSISKAHHKPKPKHKKPKPGHKHPPKKPKPPHSDDPCKFLVSQELCITLPLVFSAEAVVESDRVICLNPDLKLRPPGLSDDTDS